MTMPNFVKTPSLRGPRSFPWLIALALSAGLSGCASLSRYEQSLVPPRPDTAPPPAPAVLREAEARGYEEGLEAGKRIQARHDQSLAQATQTKAPTVAPVVAPEPVAKTQCAAATQKPDDPPPPAVKPTPAAANATAMRTNNPDAFAPSGPARPLGASPDPF
ncbi:hypothetical protein [Acidocella sp.]|uniref:hypothetical protein n=1 Tax=Acidocella sp. TaxID=50710 RepID=UPI002F42BF37